MRRHEHGEQYSSPATIKKTQERKFIDACVDSIKLAYGRSKIQRIMKRPFDHIHHQLGES